MTGDINDIERVAGEDWEGGYEGFELEAVGAGGSGEDGYGGEVHYWGGEDKDLRRVVDGVWRVLDTIKGAFFKV